MFVRPLVPISAVIEKTIAQVNNIDNSNMVIFISLRFKKNNLPFTHIVTQETIPL